jgi:hypothetical protein
LVRYSLIGSALRGELLQPDPQLLRRRISDSLNGAPSPVKVGTAPQPAPAPMHGRWTNPAIGVGVAASVALAALFTIRQINDVDVGGEPPVRAAASAVSSYVVPRDQQDMRLVSPLPVRLTNYLLHHGEYARLSRTSVHSNVVGGMDLPFVADAIAVDDGPMQRERDTQ